jgi:hypothetical protein
MNTNTTQYNTTQLNSTQLFWLRKLLKIRMIEYIVWLRWKVDKGNIDLYKKYFDKNTILELGCGSGDFWRVLKKKLSKYWIEFDLIGIDINSWLEDYNVKVYKKYIVIGLNEILNWIEKIIKEYKITTVIIPYVFHHIGSDEIILNYLKILADLKVKLVIFEEHLPSNFLKSIVKCLYISNDIVSNLLRYWFKINFKEYFWLNFKTAEEWCSILDYCSYKVEGYYTNLRPNLINEIVIFAESKN